MLRSIIVAILYLLSLGANADGTHLLSAEPGHYEAEDIGEAADRHTIEVRIKLTSFDPDSKWPASAYVGFYEENDRNEKFQFLIIRNKPVDNYVVAGYRIIEAGEEASVQTLANLPLDEAANVKLVFHEGHVSAAIGHMFPVTVKTRLATVVPYISVASGAAEFEFTPNKAFQRTPNSSQLSAHAFGIIAQKAAPSSAPLN